MTHDDPVSAHVEWALALINEGVGADEVATRFAPSFLEAVPADQFAAVVEHQLKPLGPFTIDSVAEATPLTSTVKLRGRDGAPFTLFIVIEDAPTQRIMGLLIRPAAVDVASWDELSTRLSDIAPEVGFAAVEVVDGECRPIHLLNADEPLALGSAFKLYVLGALADQVAAGRAAWDETLPLRDELRVHSSATFGETPAGTEVSLRDLAGPMISVSDNTATDHVAVRVGRDAVEAQQRVLGMVAPERNQPFLTTHEMSMLKWGKSCADARTNYLAADYAERLAILASLPKVPATLEALAAPSGPVAIDELEWFATPLDLCRAHAALHTKGLDVRAILSANPGTRFDPRHWSYVAFKGGSEPGVLCFSWLVERHDGRTFAVAAAFRDHAREIDATSALSVVEAAFNLLSAVE
jgi:beta-lactamase class A